MSASKGQGTSVQGPGFEEVVAVEIRVYISGGASESFVKCVSLPPILFTDPIRQPRFVLFNDLYTIVAGVTVNDDVFQIGVALEQNRPDGCFDESPLVV